LLLAATGKSAQLPLYVWLPDAMAGPTPVSALIHAATMVTAGIYMIARSSPIFLHSASALDIVAIVGIATAFFAATVGLAQTDIKKVFAYSTVSQLGYMFIGLGTGAFSAGVFHVMTHAFFKALLFLGAGSVIHALHGEQDLSQMGGLRKKIPLTFWTLLCAGVAIAGVPPFSGFHSKDAILAAAYEHTPWIYWVGVVTAGMTAFYVFRALFLCFFGEYRGDPHKHPHESPPSMGIPLAILAALSLGGGYINIPKFLAPMFGEPHEGEPWLMYVSVAFGLVGIFLAWLFYLAAPAIPEALAKTFSGPYRWIYNKYFVDEFYDSTVVEPMIDGSREMLWRVADVGIIDGVVNGAGTTASAVGNLLRRAQSGFIRDYAGWVVGGAILVIAYMGLKGGL
jgi:NADH-quinone oxidoreductase subunit L